MKIIYENLYEELKELVNRHAKYQKVLLVYSSIATDAEIDGIYENIKDCVIFNKVQCELFSSELVADGYKMVIFLTTGSDLLKLNYEAIDLINVYIPLSNSLLAFYNMIGKDAEGYILVRKNIFDINIYCHLAFASAMCFINLFKDSTQLQFEYGIDNSFSLKNSIDMLSKNVFKIPFVDLEIIRLNGYDYSMLGYIEIILLEAYKQLILNIKNDNLKIIDVYKYYADNVEMVDKFYKLYSNQNYIKLLKLNADELLRRINQSKGKILFYLNETNIDCNVNLDEMIQKTKEYCFTNDFLLDLYFYDIFS